VVNSSAQVCGNVAGLAGWTIAMRAFYFVNVVVLPIVNAQKKMEAKVRSILYYEQADDGR
jgi:hypothetical protein